MIVRSFVSLLGIFSSEVLIRVLGEMELSAKSGTLAWRGGNQGRKGQGGTLSIRTLLPPSSMMGMMGVDFTSSTTTDQVMGHMYQFMGHPNWPGVKSSPSANCEPNRACYVLQPS